MVFQKSSRQPRSTSLHISGSLSPLASVKSMTSHSLIPYLCSSWLAYYLSSQPMVPILHVDLCPPLLPLPLITLRIFLVQAGVTPLMIVLMMAFRPLLFPLNTDLPLLRFFYLQVKKSKCK